MTKLAILKLSNALYVVFTLAVWQCPRAWVPGSGGRRFLPCYMKYWENSSMATMRCELLFSLLLTLKVFYQIGG